jgi:TPR repeat protein
MLAANQGYALAQNKLGVLYATGQGVPQDYIRAHMWFNLSAAGGDQAAAENLKHAAQVMTPAQIFEAMKLAREWKPTKQLSQ